jgi:hypothetical protein
LFDWGVFILAPPFPSARCATIDQIAAWIGARFDARSAAFKFEVGIVKSPT